MADVDNDEMTTVEPEADTVEIDELEASGIITDSAGHKWAIPAEELADYSLAKRSAADLIIQAVEKDPRFRCIFIQKRQLPSYMANQWVPVTRKEVKMEHVLTLSEEYGTSLTSYCEMEDCIFVKKPKILVDREMRQKEEEARNASRLRTLEGSMKDKAANDGIRYDSKRVTTHY